MFEKQGQHYLLLIVLLLCGYFLATGDALSGQLWGISTQAWLWMVIATPVLHQIVVALLWRAELYRHKLTEWFGEKAFCVFKVIFTILFIARPVTLILLGISNANTLNLNPLIAYSIAVILFIPFAYTMYSVAHYFGMDRAYGMDHFNPSVYKNKTYSIIFTFGSIFISLNYLTSVISTAVNPRSPHELTFNVHNPQGIHPDLP